jgi:ankyrin repeat protein
VKNNFEVVEFLIASGASLFIVDNKGNTPLDLCGDSKLKKIIFSEMNSEVMKLQ